MVKKTSVGGEDEMKEKTSNSKVTWVNVYPTVRGFMAIGTGGDDFVQAMVVVVESVLQHQIPQDRDNSWDSISKGSHVVSIFFGDSSEFFYRDKRDVDELDKLVLES
ncbi:hypothetical protein Tco_0905641 [Tanacetum coccineum]